MLELQASVRKTVIQKGNNHPIDKRVHKIQKILDSTAVRQPELNCLETRYQGIKKELSILRSEKGEDIADLSKEIQQRNKRQIYKTQSKLARK